MCDSVWVRGRGCSSAPGARTCARLTPPLGGTPPRLRPPCPRQLVTSLTSGAVAPPSLPTWRRSQGAAQSGDRPLASASSRGAGDVLRRGPARLPEFHSVCCYLSPVMAWRQEKLNTFVPEQWSCLISPLGNQLGVYWAAFPFFSQETGGINAAIFRPIFLVH